MTTTVWHRVGPGADPRPIEVPEADPWDALAACLIERLASDLIDGIDWITTAWRYGDLEKADRLTPGAWALADWCDDWMDAYGIVEVLGEDTDDVRRHWLRNRLIQQRGWHGDPANDSSGAWIVTACIREGGAQYTVAVPRAQATLVRLPGWDCAVVIPRGMDPVRCSEGPA